MFDELFFNDKAGTAGTLATFGVGFAVRRIGGVLFGNMGDRVGRRTTLIATTLLMGIATGIIGLLPTYASIGIWAPILLTLMRVCQGLGAGAEFGGASTLLAEHAPEERRGFYGSFAQLGVQLGLVLGTLTFLLVGQLPDDELQAWGWRVPFLISFLMIFVTLYFRLRVEESPVFERLREQRKVVMLPVLETIKRYPRNVAVAAGAHIADTAVIYIFVTFSVAYVTDQLDLSRTTALGGVVVAAFIGVLMQPVGLGTIIAVQGAFNAELFGADVRYTGFAGSRELGAALVGFSPMLSVALLGWGGDTPWLVAVWMIVACLISLVAFIASPETKDVDMEERDDGPRRFTRAPAEEPTRV